MGHWTDQQMSVDSLLPSMSGFTASYYNQGDANKQGESIILYNEGKNTTQVCMPEQTAMS